MTTRTFVQGTCRLKCGLLIAFAGANVSVAQAEVVFRTIALYGEAAPGTAGTFAGYVQQPAINNAGQVIFSGSSSDGHQGLWINGSNGVTLLAQDGAPVSGAENGVVLAVPSVGYAAL